jgi:hypothetical protein
VNVLSSPSLERPLAPRERFVGALRDALDERRGYAAGKLGGTERALLAYPIVLERERDPRRLRAYELVLAHRALRHSGIFPARPDFLAEFAAVLAQTVRALDCVGVVNATWPKDDELFRFHRLVGEPIDYLDQEPDRSVPSDERRCYLPLLRGRRLLLVCPFAELLRERATRGTFEAVWRKTGKPWFEPAAVEAVELPYGFSRSTQEQYVTALDLLADIRGRVEARTFDVALIAAGTLGSMIAAAVKDQGRVGVSLGGHLQVLFGVTGRRWNERPEWRRRYLNDAWIELPERYRPDPAETDENYW